MTPEERDELIGCILEALRLFQLEQRSPAAMRQQRYRDRLKGRNESVTPLRQRNESVTHNESPSENVTSLRNAVKKEKEIPNGSSPSFSPSHTLPLNLPLAPLPSEKEQKLVRSDLNLDDLLSELKPIYPYIDLELEKSRIRGWLIANPGRKLTRRFVINWLNKIEKPLADVRPAPAPSQFVTREMIDNWCVRKGYSKLAPIARGKLMGGKHYGVPITNAEELGDALASILNDWLNTP